MDSSGEKDVGLSNYHGVGGKYKGKGVGNTYLREGLLIMGTRQLN
jgi:hypothetical protein